MKHILILDQIFDHHKIGLRIVFQIEILLPKLLDWLIVDQKPISLNIFT